jgi:hypothetical protein
MSDMLNEVIQSDMPATRTPRGTTQ